MTRVTIVIPTYERAGYVETAIESVLRQDYADLEVLVVDDGSTDDTPALLERIAERTDPARFRWWRHDNVGQAETINRGFERASGDLLGYLSSDDYLLPGAIERLVEAADAHPDADVVYPWCDVVDGADRTVDVLELPEHTAVDALRWNLCLVASGALVRRRFLERVGGWDRTYARCPDHEWWLRDPEARFVCVPERLAVWRQHEASLTGEMETRARFEEHLRLLDATFAREDLPDAVRAVRDDAYAALFIGIGASWLRPGGTAHRYVVWDDVGGGLTRRAREENDASLRWHVAHCRALQAQVEQAERRAVVRERTIEALQQAEQHRLVRIEALETALAEARATAPATTSPPAAEAVPAPAPPVARPLWLRAGRRLTPPALRHRVGVAVHRLGGPR